MIQWLTVTSQEFTTGVGGLVGDCAGLWFALIRLGFLVFGVDGFPFWVVIEVLPPATLTDVEDAWCRVRLWRAWTRDANNEQHPTRTIIRNVEILMLVFHFFWRPQWMKLWRTKDDLYLCEHSHLWTSKICLHHRDCIANIMRSHQQREEREASWFIIRFRAKKCVWQQWVMCALWSG